MNPPGPLVLVIEDEPPMRRFLKTSLSLHGYSLLEAGTGREGLLLLTSHHPEVVLLDLGLPDVDGIALTRQIREWSRVPIVVLSARGREEDKVGALDAGADDYLTKPFGVLELLARIRVALRHAASEQGGPQEEVLRFGGLTLDRIRREVRLGDAVIHLTPIEYKLLNYLVNHAGKVLTHRQILTQVWGPGHAHQTHTLRVHLAELRRKVEENAARPRLILTEPGVGYRLREEG